VDAAAARQAVTSVLDSASGDTVWLEGERAWKLPSVDAERATLEVRSDPSFGPLLRILRAERAPVVRITPITDNDIREIVVTASGAAGSIAFSKRPAPVASFSAQSCG
jgi:hypothetical protein